jgi:hypothetical protein
MTLDAMADLVTTELGVYDATSVALAKSFLSKNYIQIWDKYPWGDANGYGSSQVNAGTREVDYPDGMDRIITLRASTGSDGLPPPETPDAPDDPLAPAPTPLDSRFLDPVDSTFLIESEPTIFEDRGYVKYYEETGDRSHRKIRLYPIPTWGTTLLFFGKMQCPGLINPDDETLLRGIDTALIDYATADMLRRQRQYAKAELRYKQAQEHEASAWALEQQQANKPRRTKATTVAGNSLAEMVDAVCQICGQWTPEYRQVTREFVRRNYQALYDLYLWPESLVMVRVPYASEQVVMPAYIDKVLGIRGSDNMRMFPADAGLILDITPSVFDEIGQPISYTTLTPVGVSSLPATTTRLRIASTSAVDRTRVMIRGEVLSTGYEMEEIIHLNGTGVVTTVNSYDIPLTISKDVTLGDVTVNSATDGQSLEVIPADKRELKHQRLWFLPAPNSDGGFGSGLDHLTCLVLGKRAIHPLINDQDTPIITGAQQVLIAAAAGDVFRKLGQADQATSMSQKAEASTNVLKAKNLDQAASAPRFVPQVEPHALWIHAGCCGW